MLQVMTSYVSNGDVKITFDQKDDVEKIANELKEKLMLKNTIFSYQEMTVTHIPRNTLTYTKISNCLVHA